MKAEVLYTRRDNHSQEFHRMQCHACQDIVTKQAKQAKPENSTKVTEN